MSQLDEQLPGNDLLVKWRLSYLLPSRLQDVVESHYTPAELFLLGLIMAYFALGYIAASIVGRGSEVSLFYNSAGMHDFIGPVVILVVCARITYIMVWVAPERLFFHVISDLKGFVFCRHRLIQCAPIAVLLLFVLSMYSSLKRMIPSFHMYAWDESLMTLDRFLHFGQDPWEMLQPFLGIPIITYLLNVSYNVWFALTMTFLMWQAFSLKNRFLRMQFLYTFVLIVSLGGNVLASVFASAGPCFYHAFVDGMNPYSGLMEYLQQVNGSYEIWALDAQQFLLNKYKTYEVGMGVGISAMPSMHVAMSTLFALLALQIHRIFGYIMVFYAVLIYLGSIHLAWHYAVDGMAGVLLTILIWYAVGRFLRRDEQLFSTIEPPSRLLIFSPGNTGLDTIQKTITLKWTPQSRQYLSKLRYSQFS